MRVAITGTPGTGKTTVSQQLATTLGWRYCDLNAYIYTHVQEQSYDAERDSAVVAEETLHNLSSALPANDVIIDGHLSHMLSSVSCVCVLRTQPTVLRERLAAKQWSAEKIAENVAAEELDTILIEACEYHDDVFEVDTTNRSPSAVADLLHTLIAQPSSRHQYRPGSVSWLS